jgi:DNA-binding SARP family transcriptional activator
VFEALWPELGERSARRSLQVAASRVRKVLDPPGAERSLIEVQDHCYRLVVGERDTIDAEDFRAAAGAALKADGDERRARLERARTLWVGEPMPEERYSAWAVAYREGLKDLHAAVLTALIQIYDQAGEYLSAATAARELVDIDPFDEGAHRAMMTAYARAGRTGQALRQYLECRRTLVEELGTEPAKATATLQARILAGELV